MDVLILAAGFGTRLYPLTENIPKALVKVNNQPVLNYLIKKINQIPKIENIYILSNNKFYNQFLDWKEETKDLTNKNIKIINNGVNKVEDGRGVLNDFKYALEFIGNNDILLLSSDNLFEFDLKKIIDLGNKKNSSVSALKIIPDKELIKKYSCVLLDEAKKIINFTEKPKKPESNLASIFTYYLKKHDLKHIKNSEKGAPENIIDLLHKKTSILGHAFDEFWCDIGCLEELKQAEEYFSNQPQTL